MKKAKILSMLLAVVMMMGIFATVVLAGETVNDWLTKEKIESIEDDKTVGNNLNPALSALLGVLTIIAGAVAVGILLFIGIKYMTKGAGAKAEVKDTLLPYLIGAVLIGGASAIANAVMTMG